jgi:hypothetical protein
MKRSEPRPESVKQRETRLRQRGYDDGLVGRPPALPADPIYHASYRRGRERAVETRRA